jgi:predicted DCC family thiol-disulfide oxidoreductase YuxK
MISSGSGARGIYRTPLTVSFRMSDGSSYVTAKAVTMKSDTCEIVLIYDGECPLCASFTRMARLRECLGAITLINARDLDKAALQLMINGFDIDKGMVLKVGDAQYWGPEAIHALALMSSRAGMFNRLNYWIFRSRFRSHLLYPVMRSCRNLLLKALRKSKVDDQ